MEVRRGGGRSSGGGVNGGVRKVALCKVSAPVCHSVAHVYTLKGKVKVGGDSLGHRQLNR